MPKSKDEKGEADKKGNVNESRNAKKGINEEEGSISRLKMDKKMVEWLHCGCIGGSFRSLYNIQRFFFSSI